MGFIFAPERKQEAQERMKEVMLRTKRELQNALPFAMDPVVFDYAINEHGTVADLLTAEDALLAEISKAAERDHEEQEALDDDGAGPRRMSS
jgi:hypothetical protein